MDGNVQVLVQDVHSIFASEVMADECFAGMGNTDARNYQVLDRFDVNQSPRI